MALNMVVIAREIWDTRDLAVDVVDEGGQLKPGTMSRRYDPEDLNALEQALQIKDSQGGTVTLLSVGAAADTDVLREGLYRGVDRVVRLLPAGDTDTAGRSAMLAAAIEKLGDTQLILAGVTVPEGENSLPGAEIAGRLNLDHVSYVDRLEELNEGSALCKREIEMGSEYIRVTLPAVLSMGVYLLKDDPRTPRSAKAMLKLKLKKAPIEEWSEADLGLSLGKKVKVARMTAIPPRKVETVEVDPENEAALKAMLQDIL